MKNTNKKYSRDEQKVIIEEIQKSPHNMKQAFEAAAHRLKGRNQSSISGHFYSTLRPLLDKEKIVLTQLSTVHGTLNNAKTVARKESIQFQLIKQLTLTKLNGEERMKLIGDIMDSL